MSILEIQSFVLLGALLGTAGQVLRIVVANHNKSLPQVFISLLASCAIGTITAIALLGTETSKLVMLTFIVIGYAGTDFIEELTKGGKNSGD